jgi:pimeloyl-[acyl-carrier protein] methyl ester esterase
VYLVDLPGFGLSPYMTWDSFKEMLLQQLPEQFALVGWSMGGMFATRLAIETPHRVTHLINVASSPRFIQDAHWPGVDQHIFNLFYQQINDHPSQTLEQFIALQLQGQAGHSHILNPQVTNLTGLHGGLDVLIHWDLRDALTTLQLPALYMFGRLDSITSRRTMAIMQTLYPQFDYVMFPKAAHVPFLSHPAEFITTLRGFLS